MTNLHTSNSKNVQFSTQHFYAFDQLTYQERKNLLKCISLDFLATSCCLISNDLHLHDVLGFLTKEQYDYTMQAIAFKKAQNPAEKTISTVQKVLIYLHTMLKDDFAELQKLPFFKYSNSLRAPNYSSFDLETHETVFDNLDHKYLFDEQVLIQKMTRVPEKDKARLKQILDKGAKRRLFYVENSIIAKLETLAERYPNFVKVIELITNTVRIHLLNKQPFALPIINLQGAPGCGKTDFVKALAKVLKTEFFTINIGAMHGRFELVGGNKQYGDADLGAIGQIMCVEAQTFQPLILLDELCMARDNSSESVIQPLYALFDREQRKTFKEHYLDLPLDLSGALIMTTTNNIEQLKPALKSRLVNFAINLPSPQQMRSIAQTIYSETLTELNLTAYFDARLPSPVLAILAQLSPRTAKEQIHLALGHACAKIHSTRADSAKAQTKRMLSITDFSLNECLLSDNQAVSAFQDWSVCESGKITAKDKRH